MPCYCRTCIEVGFNLIQYTQTHGCLEFVHLGIYPQLFNALWAGNTKVNQLLGTLKVFFMFENNRATFDGVKQLGGMKAQGCCITVAKQALLFVPDTKGV